MPATPAISAKAILAHAAECIRKSMQTWNGASLAGVADAQRLLQSAVDDLKQAARELGRNPRQNPKELWPLVVALKKDVDRMSRVVDACSAFQRGLAGRLGDPGVVYDASGRVPHRAGSVTARGIEV
jgi:hypothetical protein